MPSNTLDGTILKAIHGKAVELEAKFNANVLYYMGQIHPGYLKHFRNYIEELAQHKEKKEALAIVLSTVGGSAQTAEKMVEIIRHHYPKSVYFVVPDAAMSAGTIFAMAGDKIYMDYSSSLGPIDPQIRVTNSNGEEQWVPALGYLDKVNELIEKSAGVDGKKITPAEFAILRDQNLALLRSYEQARDLSIELLKKWLVEYKFKSWTHHRTDVEKK